MNELNPRQKLHLKLVELRGNNYIYFQPPANIRMSYPAIRYNLSDIQNLPADNIKYKTMKRYTIISVTTDPDDDIIDKINALPYCTYDRHYVQDNLYHDVFSIYI